MYCGINHISETCGKRGDQTAWRLSNQYWIYAIAFVVFIVFIVFLDVLLSLISDIWWSLFWFSLSRHHPNAAQFRTSFTLRPTPSNHNLPAGMDSSKWNVCWCSWLKNKNNTAVAIFHTYTQTSVFLDFFSSASFVDWPSSVAKMYSKQSERSVK